MKRKAEVTAVVLALVLSLARDASARIRYYVDVPSTHWASLEIWSLWSVQVADGWLEDNGFAQWSWFLPEQTMTRTEFAVLLAKAFGLNPVPGVLPYPDVPARLDVYGRFDAVPWLAASFREGLFASIREGRFRPADPVDRQSAVAWLIRALAFDGFARSLSPADIQALLGRFRDASAVDPGVAAEVAAAIRLGILRGYPDGTLKPGAFLKRCEAAALVYRSAWVRVHPEPPHVSPDGDGVGDVTRLLGDSLQNGNIEGWWLWIDDGRGTIVRTFEAARHHRGAHYEAPWQGFDDGLRPLPPGLYFVHAVIRSTEAVLRYATPAPVWVDDVWLTAGLTPEKVHGGDPVRLVAATSRIGESVQAAGPWGELPLAQEVSAGGSRIWSAAVTVPASASPGDHAITFTARFQNGARREAVLNLHVERALPPPIPADDGNAGRGEVLVVLTGT